MRSAWSRAGRAGRVLAARNCFARRSSGGVWATSARGRGDARSAVRAVARLSRLRPARVIMLLAAFMAAQIELSPVSFPSKDPGVTLTGTLYEQVGVPERRPGVVILHACDGLDSDITDWGNWLGQNGYIALAVDSFGPRHVAACAARRQYRRACARSMRTEHSPICGRFLTSIPHTSGSSASPTAAVPYCTPRTPRPRHSRASRRTVLPRLSHSIRPPVSKSPQSALIDPLLLLIGASDDWTDAKS